LTDPYLWGIEKGMAKRQTRRSISVSRSTYERLRAYCETNGISMSQFVEHRVGDFLGRSIRRPGTLGGEDRPVELVTSAPTSMAAPTPMKAPAMSAPPMTAPQAPSRPTPRPAPAPTAGPAAAATRPTIVPRPAPAAPPPAKLTPDRIFTF
jgi:hypothetical protein